MELATSCSQVLHATDRAMGLGTRSLIIQAIFVCVSIPSLTLYHAIQTFKDPEEECIENSLRNRKIAGNQDFSRIFFMFSTVIIKKKLPHLTHNETVISNMCWVSTILS